jgi:hypothetical protein
MHNNVQSKGVMLPQNTPTGYSMPSYIVCFKRDAAKTYKRVKLLTVTVSFLISL